MGRNGTPPGWKATLCALAVATAVGCGGGSSPTPPPPGPPTPADPGTPIGLATSALKIGAAGGSVTSSDGLITASFPAGAVSADIDVTIEVITNTAPSAVGNAYRITAVPADTVFAAPIALVFTAPADGPALDTLTVATQDANGFWVRQQSVTRDATAGTLTVTTTKLGDWAIVGAPTGRDLIGVFHVVSTAGSVPVTADGKSSLNFHAGDLTTGWYVQAGQLTAVSPLVSGGGQTCAPAAPTMQLAPNVAEILANPDRFRWAVDGHWDLACASFPPLAYVSFDTTGINYLSCTRSYLETPLITPEKLLGNYRIDCGAAGTVTADWHFEICNQGELCPSSNPCHTASITCDTGLPLCVDDGNVPNGLSCDLVAGVNEVCGDGVCNVCRIDEACTPIGNVCHVGKYTCDTGFEICTDRVPTEGAAAYVSNGTTCDVDAAQPEVCGNGTCNVCYAGNACATNPNPCVAGTTYCGTGFETCIDTATPIAAGTVCNVNPLVDEVCNGTGTCIACTAGLACAYNSNVCVAGVTSCATGGETCENTATAIRTGELCDVVPLVPEVCFNGTCNACTAGTACATNPNKCVAGVTSCTTGQEVCVDTTTPIPNGTLCDVIPAVDEVCNNGVCNACTANLSCATNPDPLCHTGVTSCATGTSVCLDATALANGTACGTNMVCNGGACSFCEAGLFCATNADPCLTGITSCATGTSQCVDNGAVPEPNGTVCGTNQVCNGGACVSCTANLACASNPNPCVDGTTSCATGSSACVDTANVKPNGTTCDVNPAVPEVCNAGTCNACTAGLTCASNPNRCLAGVTSCTTGTQQCIDTAAPIAAGTGCDVVPAVDEVCNGAGACVACTAGLACTSNPNQCVTGVTSCATGGETCENTTTAIANGTSCGTDLVCNAGTCSSCTAGLSCTENPDPLCNLGVTSCATGTSVCVDGADRANGTTCGTDMVCNAGTCSSCTAGVTCTTNPDPLCNLGVTSCATGTSVCVDGADRANGTSCGTDLVCNAGTCSSCTAGVTCTTNPDPLCNVGVTSCATGTSVCVDGADRPNGTACGTDQVCSAGACSACTAGVACAANPDPCLTGTTSCATGTSVCVDNAAAPEPNGTSCGTDQVCNGGVCSLCTAGVACDTNPDPCLTGTTSCASGTSVCVDNPAAPEPNGISCGANQVCNGGVCSACTAGVLCDTNPDPCRPGVTSCATGTSACVDDPLNVEPNGTVCGAGQVCNGGVCSFCTAGLACDTNFDQCLKGVTSCSTGTSVCVDNVLAPEPNGTTCDVNLSEPEVCNGGVCSACTSGLACAENPDPCLGGVTSCATGTSVCVDNALAPEPNGTVCGADQVCSAGVCSACTAGLSCTTNPDPLCNVGVTSCATGTSVCVDGADRPNGTSCGTDLVCNAGTCASCTPGVACTTNPDPLCNVGVTSCATGTSVCVDGADRANGTSCGTNLVCSAGACTSCTAGLSCTTNPNAACTFGVTSCSTGSQACVDGAAKPAGTACGTDLVCSAAAACVPCTAGVACATNPDLCLGGTTSCSTGAQTCVDDPLAPEPNGTTCGTSQVCSGGVCSTCVAGVACSTNPNSCVAGTTSCATGQAVCVDTATPIANGTTCGTDLVCNAGACTSCVAGGACATNPDPCLTGVYSCSTGTQVCVDNAAAPEPNGTLCGTNLVCRAGACTTCTAGLDCSTNPNSCVAGTTSCATGAELCVDTATPVANGTSCGTNLVCSGGTCTSCTANLACTTNPNVCVLGTTSCATGTQTCVDTATPKANGTTCGTDLVCNAGTCTTCVAGAACDTDPDPCRLGTTSCATGTQACVSSATAVPDGTVCGTNQVCSGGVCTACTAGLACATNPTTCLAGTTSCSTGSQTCIDTATPAANGTTCGTDLVCNGGSCVSCTAGVACDPGASSCFTGATSCATGTSTCVATSTPKPNGTSCGADQVCSGGACVACVADAACQNPGSCYVGTTSCSTGASVCVDGATPLPDGTSCGPSSLCASAVCTAVRTVSGERKVTFWTTTGTCSAAAPCRTDAVPDDVLGGTAQVFARPAAGGTWAEIAGTFSANGSYSIPNVPAGPYRLVLVDGRGVTHVVETSSSSVDLGYDVLGRSDATLATSPTLVTFDLTGLTPWFAEDEVEATAFDVDVFDVPVAGPDVLSGQTTGGAIEDWGASSVGRALNLLAGTDVLSLHQLSTETATDGVTAYAYQRASVTATHVGQPTTLTAALAPMIDSGTVTVSWDPQAFEALLPALGPAAAPVPNPHRLLVETAPYASLAAAPVGAYGTPQLFRMVRPGGAGSSISLSPITYGRFLDVQLASEWRRAEFAATVSYTASGASPLGVLASVGRRDRMAPVPPTPIVPAIGPVQSPTVAGAGALGTIPATGPTPTIAWGPPALGTPSRYEVRLYGLAANAGATVASAIGVFQLTGTSVAVPAGLLQAGTTYFAEITAYALADERFDVAPLRRAQVFSHATTLTSPFAP